MNPILPWGQPPLLGVPLCYSPFQGSALLDATTPQPAVVSGGIGLLLANNATDIQIAGILGGTPGQLITIVSIGAGNVFLVHQSGLAAVGDRLINYATSADTPLAAGVGTATYRYDGASSRWRLVAHEQGAPITPAFNAADYTANGGGGAWTLTAPDVITASYLLRGRQVWVNVFLVTTTIVGAVNTLLQRTVPGGFTIGASVIGAMGSYVDGGGVVIAGGYVDASAGAQLIRFGRSDPALGVNWTAGVNLARVSTDIVFPVT